MEIFRHSHNLIQFSEGTKKFLQYDLVVHTEYNDLQPYLSFEHSITFHETNEIMS